MEKSDNRIEDLSLNSGEINGHMVLSNYRRALQPKILEYILPSLQEDISYLKTISEKQVEIENIRFSKRIDKKDMKKPPMPDVGSPLSG